MSNYVPQHPMLKQYVFENSGPNKKKPNADGFYEAKIQGVSKVFSDDEMFKERKWALNQKSATWRCSPCYTDISDKSTLEWWLIYYE